MERIGLRGRRYLFSYQKYQLQRVPEACLVGDTYFPTKNLSCNVYLRPCQLHLTKIGSVEVWPVGSTCFPTKNISWNVYLRLV